MTNGKLFKLCQSVCKTLYAILFYFVQAAGDSTNKEWHSKVDDAAMKFQLDSAVLTRLLETATGDAGMFSAKLISLFIL